MKIYTLNFADQLASADVIESVTTNIDDFDATNQISLKGLITEPVKALLTDVDGEEISVEQKESICNINVVESSNFIFDKYSYEKLKPYFTSNCEFYNVETQIKPFKMLHIYKGLKGAVNLNESKSVTYSYNNASLVSIRKHAFNEEIIKDIDIFEVEETAYKIFVSERFKKAVEDNNITGAEFELEWDSDQK